MNNNDTTAEVIGTRYVLSLVMEEHFIDPRMEWGNYRWIPFHRELGDAIRPYGERTRGPFDPLEYMASVDCVGNPVLDPEAIAEGDYWPEYVKDLEDERVFIVSAFIHSGTHLRIFRGGPAQCRFDDTRVAALLVVPEDHGYATPQQAAEAVIDDLNAWESGEYVVLVIWRHDDVRISSKHGTYTTTTKNVVDSRGCVRIGGETSDWRAYVREIVEEMLPEGVTLADLDGDHVDAKHVLDVIRTTPEQTKED